MSKIGILIVLLCCGCTPRQDDPTALPHRMTEDRFMAGVFILLLTPSTDYLDLMPPELTET
jgi:hypothetical protein